MEFHYAPSWNELEINLNLSFYSLSRTLLEDLCPPGSTPGLQRRVWMCLKWRDLFLHNAMFGLNSPKAPPTPQLTSMVASPPSIILKRIFWSSPLFSDWISVTLKEMIFVIGKPPTTTTHNFSQSSDGKRPSLTFLDLPWPSMTFYDLLWPSMTIYDH